MTGERLWTALNVLTVLVGLAALGVSSQGGWPLWVGVALVLASANVGDRLAGWLREGDW